MIGPDLLVSSVAATGLALLIPGGSWFSARFRHRALMAAIVLVPVGTLAVGGVLSSSGVYASMAPELRVAFDALALQLPRVPTAAGNAVGEFPYGPAYALISSLLLLRVTSVLRSTTCRVRKAREIKLPRLGRIAARRGLRIRRSDGNESPYTWGLIRPTIVVPDGWDDWPAGKRSAVIAHECAHIRRRDVLTATFSLLACCLLWANPLIWLAHRRLRQEAERACDDDVIARGAEAPAYAGYLVEIARSASSTAVPAMATPSTLSRRVTALLDPHTRRFDMPRKYTWFTVAAAFTVMSGSAALGVSSTTDVDASAISRLRDCGQLLPSNAEFVMELSANWNTTPGPAGEAFRLSFTFGDKNRPDLVGEIPDELRGFARCLSLALTDEESGV